MCGSTFVAFIAEIQTLEHVKTMVNTCSHIIIYWYNVYELYFNSNGGVHVPRFLQSSSFVAVVVKYNNC